MPVLRDERQPRMLGITGKMNFDLFDLSGKIALVTGGNKGIGYAIGQGLAQVGADVVLASRHLAEAQKAARSISKTFKVMSTGMAADVSEVAQVQALVKETVRKFGRIDILVNNAGISVRKPALEITEELWDTILDINLKGLFFCAQAVAKQMIKQGSGGRIINMSSVGAIVAQRQQAAYGASKGGICQLTRVLAAEWAKYDILVNAIGPGSIRTNMNRKYLSVQKNLKHNLGKICLGRIGNADEIAGPAIFLSSKASSYMTGQTIFVDGGWTIE